MSALTSVILPTYNRASFLPEAFASIFAQRGVDWELIVVDDGSTDDSEAVVGRFASTLAGPRPLRYVRQKNEGAYSARNAGLALASGDFIAFYDSDDLWLPDHLERCVNALESNPDVDWVYGACRMVQFQTGAELSPSTFRVDGRPRPFMQLHRERRGELHVIDDPGIVRCAVLHGLYCGLQNSVIRRSVFRDRQFAVEPRNAAGAVIETGEDQVFVVRAAALGRRFAYFDRVHVVYRVHDANSSVPTSEAALDKRLDVALALTRGYEDLRAENALASADRRALLQRLNREYFWHIGYVLLWLNGRRAEALEMFRRGLRAWPWSVACWKTYVAAALRARFGSSPA